MHATTFLSIICTVSTMESVVWASTYDQSQSGDLNVQVDLKGLHIIALMKSGKEEYVDYDYAYDYSEMTIKPQNGNNGTTLKPSMGTVNSTNATYNTALNLEDPSTLATTIMSSTSDVGITTPLKDSLGSSPTADVTTASYLETSTVSYSSTESKPTSTAIQPIVCKKGFVLNKKGECELRLQNPSTNALLKLVKLSQKLKLRRERQNLADNEKE